MNEAVAILSDIHANVHALRAVLADIEAQGVTECICLGDVVGYGANPRECIDLVRRHRAACLKGNHDAMVAGQGELDGLKAAAREGILWTQSVLTDEERAWLADLPLTLQGSDYEAVHACLHHPSDWPYVLTADMAALHFPHQTKPLCFIGHTHRPAVWLEGEPVAEAITSIEDVRPGRKQLVNVGSVGQPRDKDERACYAIYRRAHRDIWWRRVPYEIEEAQRAIAKAGLPSFFAQRLALGR